MKPVSIDSRPFAIVTFQVEASLLDDLETLVSTVVVRFLQDDV